MNSLLVDYSFAQAVRRDISEISVFKSRGFQCRGSYNGCARAEARGRPPPGFHRGGFWAIVARSSPGSPTGHIPHRPGIPKRGKHFHRDPCTDQLLLNSIFYISQMIKPDSSAQQVQEFLFYTFHGRQSFHSREDLVAGMGEAVLDQVQREFCLQAFFGALPGSLQIQRSSHVVTTEYTFTGMVLPLNISSSNGFTAIEPSSA